MVRTFQALFQAVFVYAVGVGIGLAWHSGWIPVELGSANTGTLNESEPEVVSLVPEVVPEPPLAEIPAVVTPPPPRPLEQALAQPNLALAPPSVVQKNAGAEPEWGAAGSANKAGQVLAADRPSVSGSRRQPVVDRQVQVASAEVDQSGAAATVSSAGTVSPAAPLATGSQDLDEIDAQIRRQEVLPAHRALSKLYWNQRDLRPEVLPRLEETSRLIFFSPKPHFVEPYVIQPNDQLRVIARKHQLSWEYLANLNQVDPRRIQLGQKLKVLKGPFAAVVDLNEFALTIHLQGYFVKRYLVGIGKDGASPVGKFTVLNKVENPQYTGPDGRVISADDPQNPLGERWIDLGDSYGIHGTTEPDSIGKAASRGCIRMRHEDVIEVYNFLINGSEVVIRR